MANDTVIYTAIFGGKDNVVEPEFDIPGCDLICYTDDKKLRSDKWEIRQGDTPNEDPNRNAKIYKILPHKFFPEYEYSLWIDGRVRMNRPDIRDFIIANLKESNLALYPHPERDNLADEVQACIDRKKDDPEVIKAQYERYKKAGFPDDQDLNAATIIARRHNQDDVVKFGEAWWAEIEAGSRRDQLSLPFVLWQQKTKLSLIPGYVWDNTYFTVLKHNF